jgi:hypothetical protein
MKRAPEEDLLMYFHAKLKQKIKKNYSQVTSTFSIKVFSAPVVFSQALL